MYPKLNKWNTKFAANPLNSLVVPLFFCVPNITCRISTIFSNDPITPSHFTNCPQQFSVSFGYVKYHNKCKTLSDKVLPKNICMMVWPELFGHIHYILKSHPRYNVKKMLSAVYWDSFIIGLLKKIDSEASIFLVFLGL